jgi:hypothetical protein
MKRTVLTAGVVLSALVLLFASDVHAGWVKDGALVSAAWNTQRDPQSCSDGAGGVIIVWEDRRFNANYDIYAQHIDGSGTILWATNGVAICTAANQQYPMDMISDGQDGVLITWSDYRTAYFDIFVQRVDDTGLPKWTTDGEPVCTAPDGQFGPQIVSDNVGGALIAWYDYRNSTVYDVYAQRIEKNGKWGTPPRKSPRSSTCRATKEALLTCCGWRAASIRGRNNKSARIRFGAPSRPWPPPR